MASAARHRSARDADVPRQFAVSSSRHSPIAARPARSTPQELRPRASSARARARRRDLHLAGADALHHDARLPPACASAATSIGVTKLMVSSAPARRDTKLEIMEYFRNSGLFELYGSTEAGWVTMLHPQEQLTKLGSVGRECVGAAADQAARRERAARWPTARSASSTRATRTTFDGYWKLPERTREAFRGDYCSVGDMARRDEDGYYYLVDRKSNMIISGGENIYPSEVETCARRPSHGQGSGGDRGADPKWGERVHARGGRCARAPRRPKPSCSTGAGTGSPAYKRPRVDLVRRRSRDAAHGQRQDPAPALAGREQDRRAIMTARGQCRRCAESARAEGEQER